jgi:hypothetical protein
VLDVSCAGYAWRYRPLSARAVRHAWLTDLIREVQAASYGSYGANRVHAELVLGRGTRVGHNAVAMLMQRAGSAGRNGARSWRGPPASRPAPPASSELVDVRSTDIVQEPRSPRPPAPRRPAWRQRLHLADDRLVLDPHRHLRTPRQLRDRGDPPDGADGACSRQAHLG